MIIRPCAEFSSTLPDEIEGTNDDFSEIWGEPVTLALVEMLKELGFIVEPPEYGGDHGWYLDFSWRKRKFMFQITLIHRYMLISEDISFFSKHLKNSKLIYADVLRRTNDCLRKDARFQDIEWYLLKDVAMNLRGEANPVSD